MTTSDGKDDGEVLIRGPIVMREYFNRPDATREALEDGWLHTGDLGRLDAEGRLYITGRKKEIIVLSSGKNLYPEEIEAHYRQSAFIKELCILGLSRPGEPSAERLHAVVVPDEDVMRAKGIVNVKELLRFEIEGRSVSLPAHKRILSYDISMEPLPRTTTGKIRRHEIQRRLRDRDDRPRTMEATAARRCRCGVGRRAWRMPRRWTIVARRLDRAAVRPDANLELDLGLDSMERVELLTLLEQRQGTRVAPEARATIFTVRQLVTAVESAPRTGGSRGRRGRGRRSRRRAARGKRCWPSRPTRRSSPRWQSRARSARSCLFVLVKAAALRGARVHPLPLQRHRAAAETGPYILSPNHQAYLDPFLLAAALPFRAFRDLFFVGAAEYFETPLSRWFARTVNLIPVDPDANLVTAMQAGAAGLRLEQDPGAVPGRRAVDRRRTQEVPQGRADPVRAPRRADRAGRARRAVRAVAARPIVELEAVAAVAGPAGDLRIRRADSARRAARMPRERPRSGPRSPRCSIACAGAVDAQDRSSSCRAAICARRRRRASSA